METKLFEILDNGTCMSVMATKMVPSNMRENWLLGRVGFDESIPCIYLNIISDRRCGWDLYGWPNGTSRTITIAHHHIIENFDTLKNGAVIDVLYLLGDIGEPRESEQIQELFMGKELVESFILNTDKDKTLGAHELAKKIMGILG